MIDGQPNSWRVNADQSAQEEAVSGPRLCMKCGELVELRLNDLVLWCACAERPIVNIEHILDDEDDDGDLDHSN